MELLQLRYFQTIAQFESVTQAAELYRIPQSAMSQTLARLEKELGHKLFERKNNRIYLNDSGHVFLEAVNNALTSLDEGKDALGKVSSEIDGTINVLVLDNRRFLVYCVSEFMKLYPKVHFNIMHEYNAELPCDLAICSEKAFKWMHDGEPLISEKIILAVHENNPLSQRDGVSLRELENEKFITTGFHSALYQLTRNKCLDAGFEPNISIVCDDPYFVRKYISMNIGVSLAPSVSWAGRFRSNTRLIPIVDTEIVTTSYLLYDSRRFITPTVSTFHQYLLSEAKKIQDNLLS